MRSAAPEVTLLDTRFHVETPEGISLALAPAGVVARCYAFAIDFLIRIAIFIVASIVLGSLGGFGFGIGLVVFFGLEWLYPVVFELSEAAATPGKRAMGLRVVMDSGLPLTPAASLTRNLLRGADFLPFLYAFGLVSMLLRPDFKRLGDLAAGTLVVHAARPAAEHELPPERPRPPAGPLSARAQAAIVAWAARVSRLTEARAEELAAIAAPVVVPRAPEALRVAALVGVAHWLLGRR
ncbi:MAG: RDD family protein [Caldimonas sp.]